MEYQNAAHNGMLNPAMSNPELYWPNEIDIPKNEWLFSLEEIYESPSVSEGMKYELELANYQKYKNRILKAAADLQLPKVVIFYTMLYFYRFFQRRPMQRNQCTIIALSCLYVASKKLENSRSSKSVALVSARIALNNPTIGDESRDYWHWRDFLKNGEEDVLEVLCFDLKIANPYAFFADNLDDTNEYHEVLRRKSLSALEVLTMCQIYLVFDAERIFIAVAILTAIEIRGLLPVRFLSFELDPLEVLEIKETWESFAEYDRSLKDKMRAHFSIQVKVADIERLISYTKNGEISMGDTENENYSEEKSAMTSHSDKVEPEQDPNGKEVNQPKSNSSDVQGPPKEEVQDNTEKENQDIEGDVNVDERSAKESLDKEKKDEKPDREKEQSTTGITQSVTPAQIEAAEANSNEDSGRALEPREGNEKVGAINGRKAGNEEEVLGSGSEQACKEVDKQNDVAVPEPSSAALIKKFEDVEMKDIEEQKVGDETKEREKPVLKEPVEITRKIPENVILSDRGMIEDKTKSKLSSVGNTKKPVFGGSQKSPALNSSVFFQKSTRPIGKSPIPSKKTTTNTPNILISSQEAHELEKRTAEPSLTQPLENLSKKHSSLEKEEGSRKRFQSGPVQIKVESSSNDISKSEILSKDPVTPTLRASNKFGNEPRTPVQTRKSGDSTKVTPKQSKVFGSKTKTSAIINHPEAADAALDRSKKEEQRKEAINLDKTAKSRTKEAPRIAKSTTIVGSRRSSARISSKVPKPLNIPTILSMIDSDLSEVE